MSQGSYDLVFNSDSVTVVADTVSADSQVYNNISAGIGKMTDDVDSTILLLPIDWGGKSHSQRGNQRVEAYAGAHRHHDETCHA